MLRLVVIFCLAVIGIVLIRGTMGGVGKQTQVCKIHISHIPDVLSALGDGKNVLLAHKAHHFVQLHRNVVVACGQDAGLDAVAFTALYPYLQHFLR